MISIEKRLARLEKAVKIFSKENEICAKCEHCRFTSVPEWYRGRGGWCRAKHKYVDPIFQKRFCQEFKRKEKTMDEMIAGMVKLIFCFLFGWILGQISKDWR